MKIVEEKDLIGKWSEMELFYVGFDATIIAFDENGTGFLKWFSINYTTIDTFSWNICNGYINISGMKQFSFEDDKLVEITASDLKVINVKMLQYVKENLKGEKVEVIEFAQPVQPILQSVHGLMSRDIWDTEHYQQLKKIIWELFNS